MSENLHGAPPPNEYDIPHLQDPIDPPRHRGRTAAKAAGWLTAGVLALPAGALGGFFISKDNYNVGKFPNDLIHLPGNFLDAMHGKNRTRHTEETPSKGQKSESKPPKKRKKPTPIPFPDVLVKPLPTPEKCNQTTTHTCGRDTTTMTPTEATIKVTQDASLSANDLSNYYANPDSNTAGLAAHFILGREGKPIQTALFYKKTAEVVYDTPGDPDNQNVSIAMIGKKTVGDTLDKNDFTVTQYMNLHKVLHTLKVKYNLPPEKVTGDNQELIAQIREDMNKEADDPTLAPKQPLPPVITEGYPSSTGAKRIALTFNAYLTPSMSDRLPIQNFFNEDAIEAIQDVPKTFYLSKEYMEEYHSEVRDLAENSNNEMGVYPTPSFDGDCNGLKQEVGEIPDEKDVAEIKMTEDIVKSLTGANPTTVRIPGGCYTQTDIEKIQTTGLKIVQAGLSSEDISPTVTAKRIVNQITQNAKDGSIPIFHINLANGSPNEIALTKALPVLVSQLKNDGFEFVKVSDIITP